ncbi:invasion associated locus B family protein [Aureimonas altamirensis]|uniref:invasion associated locus B family protein n=1 Tax=Aureimonas altamirensis TaxID=370622 RepID=UPI001E2F6F1B|nr:invasion associated locus B family protein [Aureimonas altamirensis]UHD46621.1 invasion associated locus B family protein [Aureimonas altamirensis]
MSLKKVLTAASALVVLSTAAVAQTPNRLEQFNDWGTYSYTAGGNKVCYVLSTPKTKEPASVNHGDIFFLVSQKPGQATAYEPQVVMGYPMREGSKVTVTVDARKFTLFTRGESAWVENPSEEPQLVAAMRNGRSMSVDATSARGTSTKYSYSLAGITAAINSIGNCR